MKSDLKPKFITTKDVAALLNVNEKMIYSLVSNKGLPATKITGKWLFPRRQVEEWLDSHVLNYEENNDDLSANGKILLLAGSDDPLFQKTLTLFQKTNAIACFFSNQGSMGGLTSLRKGLCHIGVCHLLQDDNNEYNFGFAEQELSSPPVFVNFSQREQGILIQKGNPKNIQSVNDFSRKDISIVSRPLGTGTRLLLDYEIAKSNIATEDINGYDIEVSRHLDAGLEVLSGRADAAPAIRAVASMLNIDFIPLRWERFDLLINRERFFEKGIQRFISFLHDKEFRKMAQSYTGYDVSLCGKILFPDNYTNEE